MKTKRAHLSPTELMDAVDAMRDASIMLRAVHIHDGDVQERLFCTAWEILFPALAKATDYDAFITWWNNADDSRQFCWTI